MGEAALLGAGVGGTLGVVAGHPVHLAGNAVNAGLDVINPITRREAYRTVTPKGKLPQTRVRHVPVPRVGRNPLKMGPRMAGGFVAAAATGALGAGIQAMMTSGPSREAQMLGRLNAGTFSDYDREELAGMLTQLYNRGAV